MKYWRVWLPKLGLLWERLVSRINSSLLLKINLQNTWALQLNNIDQIESKWNYLRKIIKGPALLSVVHDRNVVHCALLKLKIFLVEAGPGPRPRT